MYPVNGVMRRYNVYLLAGWHYNVKWTRHRHQTTSSAHHHDHLHIWTSTLSDSALPVSHDSWHIYTTAVFFNYYLTYSVCQCLLCKTRCFIQGHLLLLSIAVFGLNATLIFSSNILISQPHSHFSELRWRHWDRSMNQLLTSSASWGVGSPPSFKRSDRVPIFSRGCQSLCRWISDSARQLSTTCRPLTTNGTIVFCLAFNPRDLYYRG